MKTWNYLIIVFCAVCMTVLSSCGNKDQGYQQTADGLYYRFYDSHPESVVPQLTDYLKLRMDYYFNDSLIYRSSDKGEYPRIQYQKSQFHGDVLSGLGMMHEGDSASFIVRADSTFLYLFGDDTMALMPNDQVRFDIRLVQIQSEEEFKKELDSIVELRRQMEQALGVKKAQAETELINYLRDNGINEEAAYNRVFVIPINVGDGPKAALGMKALIKYEAYLLDGTFLGSSDSLDVAPYEVPIGQGKVLKGLDEGIAHMSKGEKAKIVVPYALAFGENGSETIPPFTNLLFVVEVVDLVKDNESIE